MKKWDDPQVVELSLENTEDSTCPESQNFASESQNYSPLKINCDKTKPDGTKAYEPGFLGIVCKHYDPCTCKCNYNPDPTQS